MADILTDEQAAQKAVTLHQVKTFLNTLEAKIEGISSKNENAIHYKGVFNSLEDINFTPEFGDVAIIDGLATVFDGDIWIPFSDDSQSDWNQTDVNAVDFIKNKPFGEESKDEIFFTFQPSYFDYSNSSDGENYARTISFGYNDSGGYHYSTSFEPWFNLLDKILELKPDSLPNVGSVKVDNISNDDLFMINGQFYIPYYNMSGAGIIGISFYPQNYDISSSDNNWRIENHLPLINIGGDNSFDMTNWRNHLDSVNIVVYSGERAIDGMSSSPEHWNNMPLTLMKSMKIVHKMDPKYLPNTNWNAQVGEAGYIENKPFGITTENLEVCTKKVFVPPVSGAPAILTQNTYNLQAGQKVRFGISFSSMEEIEIAEYSLTKSDDGNLIIDGGSQWTIIFENDYITLALPSDDMFPAYVRLEIDKEVVQKIDPKYLPDSGEGIGYTYVDDVPSDITISEFLTAINTNQDVDVSDSIIICSNKDDGTYDVNIVDMPFDVMTLDFDQKGIISLKYNNNIKRQIHLFDRDGYCNQASYQYKTINGIKCLILTVDGWSDYNSRTEESKYNYEIVFMKNDDIVFYIKQYPTNNNYLGDNYIFINDTSTTINITTNPFPEVSYFSLNLSDSQNGFIDNPIDSNIIIQNKIHKINTKYLSDYLQYEKLQHLQHLQNITDGSNGSVIIGNVEENVATGSYSIAEGRRTTAAGNHSHAEGYYTQALANSSHAEGYYTVAQGNYSHAEGKYTTALGNIQHVSGRFNIPDENMAIIVGNGYTDYQSNAYTLDWDGNETIAGGLTMYGGDKPALFINETTEDILMSKVGSINVNNNTISTAIAERAINTNSTVMNRDNIAGSVQTGSYNDRTYVSIYYDARIPASVNNVNALIRCKNYTFNVPLQIEEGFFHYSGTITAIEDEAKTLDLYSFDVSTDIDYISSLKVYTDGWYTYNSNEDIPEITITYETSCKLIPTKVISTIGGWSEVPIIRTDWVTTTTFDINNSLIVQPGYSVVAAYVDKPLILGKQIRIQFGAHTYEAEISNMDGVIGALIVPEFQFADITDFGMVAPQPGKYVYAFQIMSSNLKQEIFETSELTTLKSDFQILIQEKEVKLDTENEVVHKIDSKYLPIIPITQADYDALTTPDPNTFYLIIEE